MIFDEIVRLMTVDEWPIELLRASTLRTTFSHGKKPFPLLIHEDGTHLVIAVVPYLRIPVDVERAERFMDRLLHLNNDMNLAKFSVDEDGDVLLSVEWLLADLDASELRDALNVITHYAIENWDELRQLVGETARTVAP